MRDRVCNPRSARDGNAAVWVLVAVAVIAAVIGAVVYYSHEAPPPPAQAPPPPAPLVEAESTPRVPFKDIAAEAGLTFLHRDGAGGEKLLPESMGAGCAFFDYDNDGDPDILLLSGRNWPWDENDAAADREEAEQAGTVALYRNDGVVDGVVKYTDVSAEARLDLSIYAQGVAVGDYDADGDEDLFLTAVGGNHLLRNDNGEFSDVTEEVGVAGDATTWTTGAGFFDYDRDGDLDLLVCNYIQWSREVDLAAGYKLTGIGRSYAPPFNFQGTQSYLYRNDGGKFADVSEEAGLHVLNDATGVPVGKALAIAFVDYDADGWVDAFIANDTVQNFLFHNKGDGTFEEVGLEHGFAYNADGSATSAMGIDAAWFRNDDNLAIAIGNFANEMTSLYVTYGAMKVFTDEARAAGIGGPTRNSLTFGLLISDMDLDGRVDLVQTNGHLEEDINTVQASQQYRQPGQLFWNAGAEYEREFLELPAADIGDLAKPIVGRGMSAADIDGDGDLDLLISQVNGPPLLLRNDQQLGHHWLRVKLAGAPGNPRALGAVVELEANGEVQRRIISPTRSYLSQVEPIATFGLGGNDKIDALRIRWPDGSVQEVESPECDQLLTVRRDAATFAMLMNVAKAQLENGRYEEAAVTLETAVKRSPNSAPARRNLARAYLFGGKADAAVAQLRRLEEQEAEPSASTIYLLGIAAARQSRFADAAEHFQEAARLAPDNATIRFQLGAALVGLERTDEAQAEFERAIEIDPLHGGAHYQLATLALKREDREVYSHHLREFQRLRQLTGEAYVDTVALEATSFTQAESAEPPAPKAAPLVEPAFSAAPSPDNELANGAIAGLAAIALDDVGLYDLAAVTPEGRVLILSGGEGGAFAVEAQSERPIGPVGEAATMTVANAFIDPIEGVGDEDLGDQPEIAIVTPQRSWLLRYHPNSGVEDLTAAAGLSGASGRVARWVDLDHDGDVDLLTGGESGLAVWRNNGDGSFVEATAEFGLADVGPVIDVAAVDLDATNTGVDLIVCGPEKSTLYRHQSAGVLALAETPGSSWPAALRVLTDDFNNDSLPDIALIADDGVELIYGAADPDRHPGERRRVALPGEPVVGATTVDYDNDGWLDLVFVHRDDATSLRVLPNRGGGFHDEPFELNLDSNAFAPFAALAIDADNDGDQDLLLPTNESGLVTLRNDYSGPNKLLKLSLHSYVGHPSSVGTRVQIRSDDFAVTRYTQRELPIEIGLGEHEQIDSIQTLWMNGVANNEINVAVTDAPEHIAIIEFVRTSSCPFLYAWTGSGFEFITDILGGAPLNVVVARGRLMPPDPDEVIVLGPASKYAADGQCRIKVTTELREAIYLDELRLVAIDHAANDSVFSMDRSGPVPASGADYYVGTQRIQLQHAVGDDGVDRTAALKQRDAIMAEPGRVLPPPSVGFTEPLAIEFEFGDLEETDQLLLALTGWFRFGSSSTNIASSQRPDVQVIWPRLEAQDESGEWRLVDDAVGFPTGNTKTIICDLSGKLPRGAKRFRLTNSFEVRWDALELYRPARAERQFELKPGAAELGWHGFAELKAESANQPQTPNLRRVSNIAPWLTGLEGWCTRYGDICPLVDSEDARLAILNSGDGATLTFDLTSLPKLAEGQQRTLALYSRGWIKECDPNAAGPMTIEPFPGSDEASTAQTDWRLEYNTRWTSRRVAAPANADSESAQAP